MADQSKIIRSGGLTWSDIPRKYYKNSTTGFKGIARWVLLGERDDEQALNIQTRYFEIAAGGYSSLERHHHPHTVVVIRGRGRMILGNQLEELNLFDTIYIAPKTIHQFHADGAEVFGFICIVDRYRDRPEVPDSPETLEKWISDPEVRRFAKI